MPNNLLSFLLFSSLIFLTSCDSSVNQLKKASSTDIYTVDKLICSPLQSPCYIENLMGRFDVYILSNNLKAETPFTIIVKHTKNQKTIDVGGQGEAMGTHVEYLPLKGLTGYMEAKDMFMGKIPVVFSAQDNELFVTTTIVSACHMDKMMWELILTAEFESSTKESVNALPFVIEFEASR